MVKLFWNREFSTLKPRDSVARPYWGKPMAGLVMVAILWVSLSAGASAQEFRAAWADVFHVGMGSSGEVDTMVGTLVSGHYNVVVVEVLAFMDNSTASHGAHWKSAIVPWSSRVTAAFDPLFYLCQQAHANGIEVHAWLGGSAGAMYRVSNAFPPPGNATLASHPEWFIAPYTNSEANAPALIDGIFALDMGSPDAQEYIVSIVRELVTNYPIDGINWDDELNGNGYNQGFGYPAYSQTNYARSGLARYRINTGITGTPLNTDTAWADYRRRYKNELMARVQAEIQSIKSNPRQPLRHTSAALAYSPVPGSCNFTGSVPYTYFCDWAGMLRNGWVDAVIPQTYSSSTFNSWASLCASCWQYNRAIFPGIGAYLNTDTTIANEISYSRGLGLQGNAIYSYAVANNSSPYNGDWWAYAAANVYTDVVPTPSMPWRIPATATEGIVWGRIKDDSTDSYVDDAVVTVTGGPTVRTDGNGYYIAALVPATAGGTAHLTSVSKAGTTPQSTNAIALAGDVARYDLLLNAGVPRPPSNLLAVALSTSQIKLTWTDRATNETAYVIGRSTVSGGPYTETATLAVNSTGYTNGGLSAGTVYYYVVLATNAAGGSPNCKEAGAQTLTNAAPAIIGQPQSQSVVISNSASFLITATGSGPLFFRWRFNGAPISGANASTLTLAAVDYASGGDYSVLVSNSFGTALSSNATLSVLTAKPGIRLTNIWNIQAGSRPYVTSNNTERGICLNPSTGHVLLVSRSALISGNLGIFVLDANTGAQVGTMSTNGVNSAATFLLNKIDVADDGVIYGGNLTTSSGSSPFVVYRWASEGAGPTLAYSGSPDGGTTARWGDSFSVSGAGANTRILVSGSGATNAVVFTTSNGANFAPNVINPIVPVPVAEFSRGLYLLGGNTFYLKNRGTNAAKIYRYDVAAHTSAVSNSATPLEANMQAIAVVTNYNFIAGIVDDNTSSTTGHSLKVYDISSLASPLVVSNFYFLPFGSGTNSANPNFGGAVDTDGARIVGLDTQNGVVALQIVPINPPTRINELFLLPAYHRQFEINVDPGNFVIQGSSDFTNWIDLAVTRTNGLFEIIDPVTNSPARFYRTKN